MSVGGQPSTATFNGNITTLSVGLRNLMQQITDLNTYVATLGTAGLVAAGYSTQDAATVQTAVAQMNNVAGVYYGTVYQGTEPGDGNCIEFDFNNALSAYWAGQ